MIHGDAKKGRLEMTMSVKGKIILVTGASEGIGRAIALKLAEEGACLVVAARTEQKLEALASEIRQRGGSALAIRADVTRSDEVGALVEKTVAAYGRLDILVNNVGRGLRKPFVATTDEEWDRLVAVNLSSVVFGCRAALPVLERQGKGQIINIASRSGRVGEANLAAYSAVKHGVVGLTKALAEEEGPKGIHINAICPGSVRTERMEKILPQVDKSSWLAPEDVAAAVVYLAEGAGERMQGQTIDLF